MPRITEFRLPSVPSYAHDLVAGPDGEMWFAASYVHNFVPHRGEGELVREIDRISVDGRIGAVASPVAASVLTPGSEGSIWFINEGHIGKLATNGQVTEFSLGTHFPTTNTVPQAIAEGPDGNIWFVGLHYLGNVGGPPESVEVVGRMTPTGQVSEFPLAGKELGLTAVTAGPDGNVWFTEFNANKIGRVTPSGHISEFAIPIDGAYPSDIVTGPDGNLWFSEQRLNPPAAIGRIDPTGQIAEFPLAGDATYPGRIVTGAEGRLWFTYGVGAIGTIAPNGHSTRIALPHDTRLQGLALGPEGNVWYTADGDPPCEGGGSFCSMQTPKAPGIVGRIEPIPLSVEILGSRAVFRGRRAKLELACSGGSVGDLCRGALRLSIENRVRLGRHGRRAVLLAKRRYAIPTDKSRAIGLGLRHMGLLASGRLGVEATLTTDRGETIARRVVLQRGAGQQRHDHRHQH